MIRTALLASATALCIAPMAQADHNRYGNSYGTHHSSHTSVNRGCERQKNDDRLAGAVIGGLAGAVIGVAIADGNDDNYHRHRGYRGYRGYRGHRGYRGYRGHRHRGHGGDTDEILGGVVGGVIGAAIGSEVAAGSTKCRTTQTYEYSSDPYAPTRSPTGPQWEPPQQAPTRVYSTTTQPTRTVTTRTVSTQPHDHHGHDDLYGGPTETRTTTGPRRVYSQTPECTTVQRETRLPDGGVVREPVEVCKGSDGRWNMQNGVGY